MDEILEQISVVTRNRSGGPPPPVGGIGHPHLVIHIETIAGIRSAGPAQWTGLVEESTGQKLGLFRTSLCVAVWARSPEPLR